MLSPVAELKENRNRITTQTQQIMRKSFIHSFLVLSLDTLNLPKNGLYAKHGILLFDDAYWMHFHFTYIRAGKWNAGGLSQG